jgi:hypothetical protein
MMVPHKSITQLLSTRMKTNGMNKVFLPIALLVLIIASARAMGEDSAAIGYSEAGILYLMTNSGQLAKTVKASLPIRDFAVSPDAHSLVFTVADGNAYGGPLYLSSIPSKSIQKLSHISKIRSDAYADPEFSLGGFHVLLAIHGSAHGDLVEGSGPIGILDIKTRSISVLKASTRIDGNGPAFANAPHWAPDGASIVFSFETGAAVMDTKGEKLRDITSQMERAGEEWSHAVGWLGSKCVVYVAGKNQKDANQKPPRALNLANGTTSSASHLLGVPENSLVGLTAFSPMIWVRNTGGKIIAGSRDGEWEIPIKNMRDVIVRLVPTSKSKNGIPEVCQ